MSFGAEAQLWWWSYECFCPPIDHSSTRLWCSWQYSPRKGPQTFRLHCCDCHHALMLTYQNAPWWWSCEHFCLPSGCHFSLDSNSVVNMWRTLIGMSR